MTAISGDIVNSLCAQGSGKLAIINGHGGNYFLRRQPRHRRPRGHARRRTRGLDSVRRLARIRARRGFPREPAAPSRSWSVATVRRLVVPKRGRNPSW
ncbi:hypothetical protein AB0G04_35170 [Actinoplanes sp. NPDC023801]|uniref:hypothetical protein n=1 Tax=Actinoplanes sp. NPDC023801 TaxID=3154595 RepID=UPI0033F14B86